MNTDKNLSENSTNGAPKKIWSTPVFEIINKDKIKTQSTTGGVESTLFTYFS